MHEEKEAYRNWLMMEKKITKKVACDILSRTNRVSNIINISDLKSTSHVVLDLTESSDFKEMTVSVRSQLKRCLCLYREFKKL